MLVYTVVTFASVRVIVVVLMVHWRLVLTVRVVLVVCSDGGSVR